MLETFLPYIFLGFLIIFGIFFLKSSFKKIDNIVIRNRRSGLIRGKKSLDKQIKTETKFRKRLQDHITKYSKDKPGATANLINKWLKEDEDF